MTGGYSVSIPSSPIPVFKEKSCAWPGAQLQLSVHGGRFCYHLHITHPYVVLQEKQHVLCGVDDYRKRILCFLSLVCA